MIVGRYSGHLMIILGLRSTLSTLDVPMYFIPATGSILMLLVYLSAISWRS